MIYIFILKNTVDSKMMDMVPEFFDDEMPMVEKIVGKRIVDGEVIHKVIFERKNIPRYIYSHLFVRWNIWSNGNVFQMNGILGNVAII